VEVVKITYGAKIEKSVLLIDFTFWGLFFIFLFKKTISKQLSERVTVFFLIAIFLVQVVNSFSKSAYEGLGYANMAKCVFCVLYFHSLFSRPPKLSLRHEPAFWIVTGLLFYSTISTPIYLSINLFYSNHYVDLISILFPLTNIAIIIKHLLFLKGYSCTTQQPKI
jgi:hypothetical protein